MGKKLMVLLVATFILGVSATGCGKEKVESEPIIKELIEKAIIEVEEESESAVERREREMEVARAEAEIDAKTEDPVVEDEPTDLVNEVVKETLYATTSINVRGSASEDGENLGSIAKGNTVTKTGVEGDWSIIEYEGSTAYVSSKYLSVDKPVVEVAKKTETTAKVETPKKTETPKTETPKMETPVPAPTEAPAPASALTSTPEPVERSTEHQEDVGEEFILYTWTEYQGYMGYFMDKSESGWLSKTLELKDAKPESWNMNFKAIMFPNDIIFHGYY